MINHDSPTGDTGPRTWSEKERRLKFETDSERGDFYRFFNHEALCYKKMWKNLIHCEEDLNEVILNTDREEGCFFVEYREGMDYEAAGELFHIENDNKQLKKSYTYTQWGLWIAAISAFVTALGVVISTIKSW